MAGIHLTDIEAALAWWRAQPHAVDGLPPSEAVALLTQVHELMVRHHESECDEVSMPRPMYRAWLAWYERTPDTPCIAICSTSQGDALCKGCGRTFGEVQHWPEMTPAEKRATWRRITQEHSAWRFNRYAERAREGAAR